MNIPNATFEKGIIRSHDEIEAAVNRGLAALMLRGAAAGAAVMRKEGVPLHVSARVLGKAGQRRGSDWQQNGALLPVEPGIRSK